MLRMGVGIGERDASECHFSYVITKIRYFLLSDSDAIVSGLKA
jgi:hypothetical protein